MKNCTSDNFVIWVQVFSFSIEQNNRSIQSPSHCMTVSRALPASQIATTNLVYVFPRSIHLETRTCTVSDTQQRCLCISSCTKGVTHCAL